MRSIQIIPVSNIDITLLQSISKQTFIETFSNSNTTEDIDEYVNERLSQQHLANELMNEYSNFYFACYNGEVIGYLKLNKGPSQTELKEADSIEIERIYVLKAFHGLKIGQLLLDHAIQIAKKSQMKSIWLGVWERNIRAIEFYKKNGFVTFDQHTFMLGSDTQIDLLMRLILGE